MRTQRSKHRLSGGQAYSGAIARAVARKRREDGEAHVVDLGAGAGLLAVLAARGGASSVVACDLHPALAAVARRVPPPPFPLPGTPPPVSHHAWPPPPLLPLRP